MPVSLKYANVRRGHGTWCFWFDMVKGTGTGDIVTQFTPGFSGFVTKFYWVQDVVCSTGAKDCTYNIEINATNLAGGVISLDSDVAGQTTIGAVTASTAITGGNAFDTNDTISIETVVTAAFSEGSGTFVIEYEYNFSETGGTSRTGNIPDRCYGEWSFYRNLDDISDADVITTWTPGFAGRICNWYSVFCGGTPGSTKSTTLNMEVGTTDISTAASGTDSAIALTSANNTTLGTVTAAGTKPLIGAQFDRDDTLSIEATSTSAFTGGIVGLHIQYETKRLKDVGRDAVMANKPDTFQGAWCFPIYAPNFANGDMITNFTPGFGGRITKWYWVVDNAMAASGKTTTLNLEIGTTNVTGGTLVIASNTLTTKGEVQAQASAFTAGTIFNRTDTISVEASATTTHTDTEWGTLVIEYEGDIINAI